MTRQIGKTSAALAATVVLLGWGFAGGQETPAPQAPPAEPAQGTQADEAPPAPQVSDDEFIPSEEVQADEELVFPINI